VLQKENKVVKDSGRYKEGRKEGLRRDNRK
jgi:hypothetical protein